MGTVSSNRDVRRLPRRAGFTLAEVLVVVGIIALLVALLVPTIWKAKEGANQAACANNLRQIGMAFIQYGQAHDGKLPYHADWGPPHPEDWIHWQPGPGRDNNDLTKTSAIGKYLGKFTPNVFRCPSDDPSHRTRYDTSGQGPRRYDFSYSFNGFFASNWSPAGPRLMAVVNPAAKIMVIEEDELSLDDGHYWPDGYGGTLENYLGTRHTRPRLRDYKSWQGMAQNVRPDRNERGNVAFADGHVELVTRSYLWNPNVYDPRK